MLKIDGKLLPHGMNLLASNSPASWSSKLHGGGGNIAFADGSMPYIVTMNFGRQWDDDRLTLYFHCAKAGRKIDLLNRNNRVCFEFDTDVEIVSSEEVAGCGTKYSCVIGFGTVREITDPPGRLAAMNQVMLHYSGKHWEFDPETFAQVRLWCISIDQLTGKRREV